MNNAILIHIHQDFIVIILISPDSLLFGADKQGFIQDFFEMFYLLEFKKRKDESLCYHGSEQQRPRQEGSACCLG